MERRYISRCHKCGKEIELSYFKSYWHKCKCFCRECRNSLLNKWIDEINKIYKEDKKFEDEENAWYENR